MQNAQINNDILIEFTIRKRAAQEFILFIKYTKPDFSINWHHTLLAHKLQQFAEGTIKKLMIFLPPQVGKSEMSTRRLPAFILGKYPDKSIAICAYNQTFASQFNRDIQRIMTDQRYKNIFPKTLLNAKNVATDSRNDYLRNSEIFEVVGYRGRLKSVGVGGPLTGSTVDVGIIDDPIKGANEAFSITFRERLWDWYTTVFKTRLHNNSQQLITLTRWHEDDLAGRIIKSENDWEIITIPSIRENFNDELDPREIGEVLWPEKHSLQRMLEIKTKTPLIYESLYQQRPFFTKEEGRFAHAFDRNKHVKSCRWNPQQYTYLSFDFNRNPICCTVIQWYNETIYIPKCIKLKNSNIYDLCRVIKKMFPSAAFIVTGDATGKHSSALVEDNLNYYIVIKTILNLTDEQFKVPSVNPPIESNKVLLNALLQHYNWCIDPDDAQQVIFDMEYVKVLPTGKIDKDNRGDPTKQADAIDTVRYWCNYFMSWFLKDTRAEEQNSDEFLNDYYSNDLNEFMPECLKSIQRGVSVSCTIDEYYGEFRDAILHQAKQWLETNDGIKAQFALDEIKRLDNLFENVSK